MTDAPSPRLLLALACAGALVAGTQATTARAAEPVQLTLKDHQFSPATVSVPGNERFRIEITNQDAEPAEFESADLRAEKIVVPGGKIGVFAGPLKAGTYAFFDDYHPDTAKGTLTVVVQQAGPVQQAGAAQQAGTGQQAGN